MGRVLFAGRKEGQYERKRRGASRSKLKGQSTRPDTAIGLTIAPGLRPSPELLHGSFAAIETSSGSAAQAIDIVSWQIEYSRTTSDLIAGVVQVRPFESDRHASSGLAVWILRTIENQPESKERWSLLEQFQAAFSGEEFLKGKAAEAEVILRAIDGVLDEPLWH